MAEPTRRNRGDQTDEDDAELQLWKEWDWKGSGGQLFHLRRKRAMDYEGLLELVKKRRSIRKFKPHTVPDEIINKILDLARWAPSGSNHQPWEFIVVKDKATKGKITAIVEDSLRVVQKLELTREKGLQHPGPLRPVEDAGFKDAPVFIVLLGDPRTRQAQVLQALQGPNSYISSLANVFLYMHLAAAALGLGSRWVSASSQYVSQALMKEALNIPKGYDIYDLLILGYPDQSPRPRKVRDLRDLVHEDHYDMSKYRSDAEVRLFAREIQLGHTREKLSG